MTTEDKFVGALLGFVIAACIFCGTCWVVNVMKLARCDFEPPYRGEVIHAIGLIPAAAVVTVWFDDK
jgi:hypothetical protein